MTTLERILSKVVLSPDGCMVWHGSLNRGYGAMGFDGTSHLVHRVMYETFVGPIPVGLVLDHLCRVPACVNPTHVEPVTQRENIMRSENIMALNARKTHCPQGHPYDDENTIVDKQGHRRCARCRIRQHREEHERNRERYAARRRERRLLARAA